MEAFFHTSSALEGEGDTSSALEGGGGGTRLSSALYIVPCITM